MTMSRKDLESIICVACGKAYGDHSRKGNSKKFSIRSLMECFFRVQGSYVSDGIQNNPIKSTTPSGDDITVVNDTLEDMTSPEEYNDVAYEPRIDDVEWKE